MLYKALYNADAPEGEQYGYLEMGAGQRPHIDPGYAPALLNNTWTMEKIREHFRYFGASQEEFEFLETFKLVIVEVNIIEDPVKTSRDD